MNDYDRLLGVAADLVLESTPHGRAAYERLCMRAQAALEVGEAERAEILTLAATRRQEESQAAKEAQYQALSWYGWPDDLEEPQGLSADVDDSWAGRFWLEVQPGDRGWAWEAWKIDANGYEAKIGAGSEPVRAEAQRAAWEAVIHYEDELADQEQPF